MLGLSEGIWLGPKNEPSQMLPFFLIIFFKFILEKMGSTKKQTNIQKKKSQEDTTKGRSADCQVGEKIYLFVSSENKLKS